MVTFETALRCLLSACLRRRPKAAEDSIATIVLLLCSGLETADVFSVNADIAGTGVSIPAAVIPVIIFSVLRFDESKGVDVAIGRLLRCRVAFA